LKTTAAILCALAAINAGCADDARSYVAGDKPEGVSGSPPVRAANAQATSATPWHYISVAKDQRSAELLFLEPTTPELCGQFVRVDQHFEPKKIQLTVRLTSPEDGRICNAGGVWRRVTVRLRESRDGRPVEDGFSES
jgi:hypothetical protein